MTQSHGWESREDGRHVGRRGIVGSCPSWLPFADQSATPAPMGSLLVHPSKWLTGLRLRRGTPPPGGRRRRHPQTGDQIPGGNRILFPCSDLFHFVPFPQCVRSGGRHHLFLLRQTASIWVTRAGSPDFFSLVGQIATFRDIRKSGHPEARRPVGAALLTLSDIAVRFETEVDSAEICDSGALPRRCRTRATERCRQHWTSHRRPPLAGTLTFSDWGWNRVVRCVRCNRSDVLTLRRPPLLAT